MSEIMKYISMFFFFSTVTWSFEEQPARINTYGTGQVAVIVASCLTAFESVSGYRLSPEEAIIALEKTGTSTVLDQEPYSNQRVITLEIIKQKMVGNRLKTMCGAGIACFLKNIRDDNIYVFETNQGMSSVNSISDFLSYHQCFNNP